MTDLLHINIYMPQGIPACGNLRNDYRYAMMIVILTSCKIIGHIIQVQKLTVR